MQSTKASLVMALLSVLWVASDSEAALTNVNWIVTGTSAWETAENWSPAVVPSSANESKANIFNGGTAEITQTGQTSKYLMLSEGVNQTGYVHLISGTLLTTDYQNLGRSGVATFTQEGGTTNISGGTLTLGQESGSRATYRLKGGVLNVPNSHIYVGYKTDAIGTIEQSGGTLGNVGAGRYVHLGYNEAGAVGNYILSGGGQLLLTNANNFLYVGYNGRGTFVHSNGTVVVSNYLFVGKNSNASGLYWIQSGSLSVGQNLVLGEAASATGTLQVVGSSATLNANVYQQNAISTLDIQMDGSGISTLNVAGNASINGELKIASPVPLSQSSTVTVINASSLSGTFSLTNYVAPLAGAKVIYDTGNGDVKLTQFQYTQPDWIVPGTGAWEGAGNWSGGQVPWNEANATVNNGGTATITQAGQVAGTLTLGQAAENSGSVHLSTGTLATASTQNLGRYGNGQFVQEAETTNTCGGDLYVGEFSTQAVYQLNGGLLSVPANEIDIGYKSNSNGRLEQSGGMVGSLGNGKYLYLGRLAGAVGSYQMTGGALVLTNVNYAAVGNYGTGHFLQDSGTVLVDQQFNIGKEAGANGDYTMNNGSFLARWPVLGEKNGATGTVTVTGGSFHGGRHLTVGQYGHGAFHQSGGVVGVTNEYFYLGEKSTGSGTYILSGTGKLLLTNAANYLYVGWDGKGTFIQSNGTVVVSNYLFSAKNNNAVGMYQIINGSLTVGGNLVLGEGASATGTLQIVGSAATISAKVYQQNANSTLDVQMDANGISTINVSGNASLNGTLKLAGSPFLDSAATVTVINASSLSGNFSRTNFVAPLIRADILYDVAAGDVKLTHFLYTSGAVYKVR